MKQRSPPALAQTRPAGPNASATLAASITFDGGSMTEDEQAIRGLMSRTYDAWASADARAYAEAFTEDSDYVAFDGTRCRGRAENEALHASLFGTVLKGTRLQGAVESVRFLTREVAVAHATGSVVWPWQKQASRRRLSRQTLVLVKRDGSWRIAAFHNTRVRPSPSAVQKDSFVRGFRKLVELRSKLSQPGKALRELLGASH
jgi:uncharacterized protein (TIGR02246 family)